MQNFSYKNFLKVKIALTYSSIELHWKKLRIYDS